MNLITPTRELELFRASKKVEIRRKGIGLDQAVFDEIDQMAKDINSFGDLAEPTTTAELLEVYNKLIKELVTIRFQEISSKIAENRKRKSVMIRQANSNGIISPTLSLEVAPKGALSTDAPRCLSHSE